MPVDDAPADDDVRQSYNFAPGYHGLVYRADGPEHDGQHRDKEEETAAIGTQGETAYKLSKMQWGMTLYNHQHMTPRTDTIPSRPRPLLDKVQPRLRQQDEDNQLPRRFSPRRPRHVDHHEEEEALHRRRTGLLRMAQEGQPEDTTLHQTQGWPAAVPGRAVGRGPV
jgi:hypothetical protein